MRELLLVLLGVALAGGAWFLGRRSGRAESIADGVENARDVLETLNDGPPKDALDRNATEAENDLAQPLSLEDAQRLKAEAEAEWKASGYGS